MQHSLNTTKDHSVDGALVPGCARDPFSAPSEEVTLTADVSKPRAYAGMTVRRMSAVFVAACHVAERIDGSEEWTDSQVRTCIRHAAELMRSDLLADIVLMLERDDTAVRLSDLQDLNDLVPRVARAVGAI